MHLEELVNKLLKTYVEGEEYFDNLDLNIRSNNKYLDYMKHLNINDLTNLKFYVSNKVNVDNKDNLSGSIKLLRIISRLLKEKETHKLNFNE